MTGREAYLNGCREFNKKIMEGQRVLLRYIRRGVVKPGDDDRAIAMKREKIGVVVAYRVGDEVKVGFSKVHRGLDKFQRDVGIRKALERARDTSCDVPSSIQEVVAEMTERAHRYFFNTHS